MQSETAANVRIVVPDVDRLWVVVGRHGLVVERPIEDRAYGLRDFTVLDPDGFGLRFATPLRIQSEKSRMTAVRVGSFTISLDGYGAGLHQSLEHPLGVGGEELHGWMLSTRTWRQVHGMEGGETGIDDDFAAQGFENTGAWILGRTCSRRVVAPGPT